MTIAQPDSEDIGPQAPDDRHPRVRRRIPPVTATRRDRIPEILKRVPIEAYLAELGHAPARESGATATYRCPFPDHADYHPSFTVRAGRGKCWSQCDWSGDVIDLAIALEGCPKPETIERLAASIGISSSEIPARLSLPKAKAEALFARFVADRQWDPEAVDEMGLHAVIDDFRQPRIRFPYLYGKDTVWYQDRALGGGTKWISPMGQRTAIFNAIGLELAAERDGEVWILEGPCDVMALLSTFESPAAVGIPGAGNFRPDWVDAFAGLRQVVIVGDNDESGLKFRAKCRSLLSPVVKCIDLHVPEHSNDLDDWRRADPGKFAAAPLWAAQQAEGRSEAPA